MYLYEYISCPICGEDKTELIYKVRECTGKYQEIFNLVQCKKCKLAYVNPRPSKEELLRYYPEESYYAYKEVKNKINFKNKIKNLLLEIAGGYSIKNYKFFVKYGIIQKILKRLSSHLLLCVVPFKKEGKLLDVGCGNGSFLMWHKTRGWDVLGIDISKSACDLCEKKGIKVFKGELQDAKIESESFDVVTLIQVLEHLHDPIGTLKEINRVLKNDGLLIIGVPNYGCFDRKILGKKWPFLEIPRHLYHFDIGVLRNILDLNGFNIIEIRGKGFYLYGIRALRNIKKGTQIFDLLKIFINLVFLKLILLILSKGRKEKYAPLISFFCKKVI